LAELLDIIGEDGLKNLAGIFNFYVLCVLRDSFLLENRKWRDLKDTFI